MGQKKRFTKKEKEKLLARAKEFFFKAMINGWASNGKGRKNGEYKEFLFAENEFQLVDKYCVIAETKRSTGTTTIFFRNNPIWFMVYGGFYQKKHIPFLKEVLLKTYKEKEFFGGRGFYMKKNKLIYINKSHKRYSPIGENCFTEFSGEEKIVSNATGRRHGYHNYFGMALI